MADLITFKIRFEAGENGELRIYSTIDTFFLELDADEVKELREVLTEIEK